MYDIGDCIDFDQDERIGYGYIVGKSDWGAYYVCVSDETRDKYAGDFHSCDGRTEHGYGWNVLIEGVIGYHHGEQCPEFSMTFSDFSKVLVC